MEESGKEKRKIKKYANRKLYDTMDKKYVSFDKVTEMIKSGEDIIIEDNETGDDITSTVVSQLLARENKKEKDDETSSILIQLLRKGGGTISTYAKKYMSLWQNALTMAEDEVDKLVGLLVKNKEITASEGSKLKKEILGYKDNFKKIIGDVIEQRVKNTLNIVNVASRDQVQSLTRRVEDLTIAVEKLERLYAEQSNTVKETQKNETEED